MSNRQRLLTVLAAFALAGAMGPAAAQSDLPRVGISASPDHYVDSITVDSVDETITLYACIFGPETGGPLTQPLTKVAWVIHQVCCGAEIFIHDVQYNPEFTHVGHPLIGVQTEAAECIDRDGILLATITASILPTAAGDLLWAAGPFGPARDCDGTQPFFRDMPVTIVFDGEVTPEAGTSWGSLKAVYR